MKSLAKLLAIASVLGLAVESASAQAGAERARFVGTWRLISLEVDGQPGPATGPHPSGRIYYDAAGNMAAQIVPDRPRPKWQGAQPTPDEARETVLGYVAYFGTYAVDERERTVSHRPEGAINPSWTDTPTLVRRYEFVGDDRLILIPVDRPGMRLVWERIR
jgi:hypothetical protein